jgi:uncharacterized membrane protein YesL
MGYNEMNTAKKGDRQLEFKGLMGGLYRLCEWIMRLSVVNVLWFVFSFPIFYLGLVGLVSAQSAGLKAMIPSFALAAVISPFLLFPATGAMFSVARKWVLGDEDVPLFKTFLRGYKENYLQSMKGGLIFLLFGIVMYSNYWYYSQQSGSIQWLAFLFAALSVFLFAALFHYFSIMVHFHMKFWQIVRNAILISFGYPLTSVALVVVNFTIFFVSVSLYQFVFLILFFAGSVVAVFSFWNFRRIFARLQAKREALMAKQSGEQQTDEGASEENPPGGEAERNEDSAAHDSTDLGKHKDKL